MSESLLLIFHETNRWDGTNTSTFTEDNGCCNFERRQRVSSFPRTASLSLNVETSPSHQEDYHAIAALSLDPEGLRLSIKKTIGIDWEPENALDPIARQVVFVGLYDGYVNSPNSGHFLNVLQAWRFYCLSIFTSRAAWFI